jgi:hypothetical protein
MNAQIEFEQNLATLLDYTKMKLSIVKGEDKQYHLQAESWIYPEPFYLDEFLNIDFSKNMFWDKHITPIVNKTKK